MSSVYDMEFPLGLAYISAVLKKAGHDVQVLNFNIVKGDIESEFARCATTFDPQLVGTGGLSPQYQSVQQVSSAAAKVFKRAVQVVGGSVISGDPLPALSILDCDFGVLGEGENTIVELASLIEQGAEKADMADVAGLVFQNQNGEIIFTEARAPIENLDNIPLPDYEGFGFKEYVDDQCANVMYLYQLDTPRAGLILTSRSCPFSCSFCFHPLGKKFRVRNLDSCFEEINMLQDKYSINIIAIQDELFSTNKTRVMEFCRRIQPMNLKWSTPLRVNGLDKEMVQAMKESGCFCVPMGIESMHGSILKSMRKQTTPEDIESALALVHNAGLNIAGNFIFGDTAETAETVEESISFWKAHPEYNISLRFITPYPGTELYKKAVLTGRISSPSEYLSSGCPIVNMTEMSDDDFVSLLVKVWGDHVNPLYHLKAKDVSCRKSEENETDKDCYVIEFVCPSCLARNHYAGFTVTSTMIHGCIPTICCRHCNQKMLLFDYPQSACSENLQKMLLDDIVLWNLYNEWIRVQKFTEKEWLQRMRGYLDKRLLSGRIDDEA
jgi:radical SAM superfamily enzyme YgiQ (UPF0313 family)